MNIECLCIPRVINSITENHIRKTFTNVNIGLIDHIDIVNKTTDKGIPFKRVFIHFKKWFATENGIIAQQRLLNNQEIKIIYDDPWFWKVSLYRKREFKK